MKKKAGSASQRSKRQSLGIGAVKEIAASYNGKTADLMTTLRSMRNKAVPSSLYKQHEKAKDIRERNDLVGSIIDTQVEFGNRGFQFYIKNQRAKKRFQPLIERFNLVGLNEQLWNSLCTHSNVVLHWKMKSQNTVEYINVLNPYDVDIVPGLNNDCLVYLKVPDMIRKLVNARSLSPEEKKLLEHIPKKYVEAVKGRKSTTVLSKRDNMVLLSNDDGEYWLISNLDGFSDRLTSPKMKQVFDSVENRELLISGDESVALMIKNFILQVKAGESITSGPKTGSTQNWVNETDIKHLKKEFETLGRAMWVFTNHTVDIMQHFPDVKIFDPIKYVSPESRILTWGGVGKILMLGEGANFAAGFINLKRLIAKVKKHREIITDIWDRFFLHPTIKGDIAKQHIPKLIYDDSLLKEANVDLKEKTMLIDRGGLSTQTALIQAGFDPDIEEKNKAEELDKQELYLPKLTSMTPIDEAISRKKEKQDPGRPGNEVPSHGETTMNAPQNPKPSTASESQFMIPRTLLGLILEHAEDPIKEVATVSQLPSDAMNVWGSVFVTFSDDDDYSSFSRKAWASVRTQFKRSKGQWIKKGDRK